MECIARSTYLWLLLSVATIVICHVSGFHRNHYHNPYVFVHAFSMWKKHIPFYSRRDAFIKNPQQQQQRRTRERNMFSATAWPTTTTLSTFAVRVNPQPYEQESPDSWCDIHYLHQRIEQYIHRYQHPLSPQPHKNDRKLCFVFAGGGSTFLSTLAATPGASKILLEGTVTYSRSSFDDYIRTNYNNNQKLEENDTNDGESYTIFKYCSEQAATILAKSASKRAMTLIAQELQEETVSSSSSSSSSWSLSEYIPATGVACTSVLKTESRSYRSHGSRIFINIQNSHRRHAASHYGNTNIQFSAILSQKIDRTRFQEDVFVAHCIMSCLEYLETNQWTLPGGNNIDQTTDHDDTPSSLQLDDPNHGNRSQQPIILHTPEGDEIRVRVDSHSNDADDIIRYSTERVSSGRESAVLLVPEKHSLDNEDNNTTAAGAAAGHFSSYAALPTVLLPQNALIVPGSFNPPHSGHVLLAKAAAREMKPTASAIFFELSITNADKPPLMANAVVNRLKEFHQLSDMPDNWGILLTNAPLFKQKVDLLAPLQLPSSSSSKRNDLHFCIGTDTLVRLIDPKYYGNSPEQMIHILSGMPSRFLVGGRLDQQTKEDPTFFTGREFIHQLPPDLQTKFTILSNFRVDISSTEIRKKKLVEQNQSSSTHQP